jgi:hypothetical protein
MKIKILENLYSSPCALLRLFQDFSDKIDGYINKCSYWVLYSKMCQYLENLHNSANQYFQNYAWVKDLLKPGAHGSCL